MTPPQNELHHDSQSHACVGAHTPQRELRSECAIVQYGEFHTRVRNEEFQVGAQDLVAEEND